MGVICGGSFLILIQALTTGGAGFVLTSRNMSVLFATVIACDYRRAPESGSSVGAVLVAGGALLMAW